MAEPLMFPRKLAQRVFAHAQRSPDSPVCGAILSQAGAAADALPLTALDDAAVASPAGEDSAPIWAFYRSAPQGLAPGEIPDWPRQSPRLLVVALDTKGVLQLRLWERKAGRAQERGLRVID